MSVTPSEGLGRRLSEYRRLAGLSARELAEAAGSGLSRGVIANIESGRKADLTVDQLIAVSAALGVPPVALALPMDQPLRNVRLTRQEHKDDTHSRLVRSWAAVEWFNGGNWVLDAGEDRPNPASALSRSLLDGIREYVIAHTFVSAQRKLGRSLDEAEAQLESAEANLRRLGVDLTAFSSDE